MRTAVLLSVGSLLVAIILLSPVIFTQQPVPDYLMVLVYPGFAALVMSPVILFATALTSLMPSVRVRLENCQH
jgi:hypothetical protein